MFGNRLKQLRSENNLTQQGLAEILKVSPSTIGMYEQNRRDPDTTTLKFLADYFKVTVDFLLGRTNIRDLNMTETLAVYKKDGCNDKLTDDEMDMVKAVLAAYRKEKQAKP